ncbi:MAG: ATP-sensitive inward rectifier potassium channel 10 [Alphaproteobacteria bacterium]|nr:ATP-sensitive inward rectifier potassium channel 10 [Alphaproteobacteria bacterium]MBL6937179.1 ATP-sensitive inward rectifier potassium channel 10 [Alphaproteobacteria bacterium]MBL7096259.1 ATP-sensitive inward rectifier potassium channel 10 [Alphaproteobacteria bacterium]
MSTPNQRPVSPPNLALSRPGARLAIVKGQDRSRWTDFYHLILTVTWLEFFGGLFAFFVGLNLIFVALYLADPAVLAHSRHSGFWDVFLFSFQTIASIDYTGFAPQSTYSNIVVAIQGFFSILTTALFTGVMFARFSRPFARIVFSRCALVLPFDGVPTLMFRAANQRGNSIVDAEVRLTMARQQTSREGIVMRRFEDLKPFRARSSLFALSWTIMHRIDRHSPLYGMTAEKWREQQIEVVVMLSGLDEALADRIYARHSYSAEDIVWDHKFVDVISSHNGRRVVDLTRFHDTEPLCLEPDMRDA